MRRVIQSGWPDCVWLTILLVVATAPAWGNPINIDMGALFLVLLPIFAVLAVLWFGSYLVVTLGTEAAIIGWLLGLDRASTIRNVLLMNLVSAGLGVVLFTTGSGAGWKSAFMMGKWDMVALLWVRSLALGIAVESGVLMLLLRKQAKPGSVMTATALANVASYLVTLPLLLYVRTQIT